MICKFFFNLSSIELSKKISKYLRYFMFKFINFIVNMNTELIAQQFEKNVYNP